MNELIALKLGIIVLLVVRQTVKATNILQQIVISKRRRDVVVPKHRFFQIQLVFLLKVALTQIIRMRTGGVLRLKVTLLITRNEGANTLLSVRCFDYFRKTHKNVIIIYVIINYIKVSYINRNWMIRLLFIQISLQLLLYSAECYFQSKIEFLEIFLSYTLIRENKKSKSTVFLGLLMNEAK